MAYTVDNSDDKTRKEKVCAEARANFKICADAERDRRVAALDDLTFLDGEQWDPRSLTERAITGRPALVVNRLDQFVQHITNSLMQQRIAARVFPVSEDADADTAEVIQGHLRHIEYESDADLAYNTGAFYAVAMGWGVWRVVTKYCDPMSFDTELSIERLRNPFQAYFDPWHDHPTGKDAKMGFIVSILSEDEYKNEYPNSDLGKIDHWTSIGDQYSDWVMRDGAKSVRVAEYYKIESTSDTLVRLTDGSARLKSELPTDFDEKLIAIDPKTGEQVTRPTDIAVVKWYKTNGIEILDETVWPTSPDYVCIPMVKVIGSELDVNGKLKLKGIIRNLKDAQRQYNFMLSAQTEAVDASKGQIVVTEGQIEGHEEEWETASKRKVLTVTGKSIDNQQAKDPFRLAPNMSIQSMTEARLMAADDLKALTGIYDSALGAASNETSGIAIRGRQAQSETANYHFTGNLVRSINHTARICIGAIPIVIDTPRAIRIVGEDMLHKVVKVNQGFQEGEGDNAVTQHYKVSKGKYNVVCEAGPNPRTKEEQDSQLMTEIVKVAPGLMQVAPDLILKALGAPQELVDRVRPPQFQNQDGKAKIPPAVQMQMQQLQQQNQVLTQELNTLSQQVETKAHETASKERMNESDNVVKIYIAELNAKNTAMIAELNSNHEAAMATMQAEFGNIQSTLDSLRQPPPVAAPPQGEQPQNGIPA